MSRQVTAARRGLPKLRSPGDVVRWSDLVVTRLNSEALPGTPPAPPDRSFAVDVRDFNGIDLAGNNDSTAAVNAALLQAFAAGKPCFAPAGAIRASTIKLPTATEFGGAGMAHTRIISDGSDAPIIASKSYFAADAHPVHGRPKLHDMRIEGTDDQAKPSQHGVLLRDFFADLYHLEIRNTGGSAIRFESQDNAGTPLSGTAVNNRIRSCSIYQCRGQIPLVLGPTDGPFTDGIIQDLYLGSARTGSNAGYTQLFIGHAAGWFIDKLHTYTHHNNFTAINAATCLHLHRPWHAQIGRIYLEQWEQSGVYLQASDGITRVHGVSAWAEQGVVGSSVIYADCTPGSSPVFEVGGLAVTKHTGTNAVYGVTAADGVRVNMATPPSIAGAEAGSFTGFRKLGTGTVHVPDAAGGWASI